MNKAHLMCYRKQLFACLLAFELIPAIRNKVEIKKKSKVQKITCITAIADKKIKYLLCV